MALSVAGARARTARRRACRDPDGLTLELGPIHRRAHRALRTKSSYAATTLARRLDRHAWLRDRRRVGPRWPDVNPRDRELLSHAAALASVPANQSAASPLLARRASPLGCDDATPVANPGQPRHRAPLFASAKPSAFHAKRTCDLDEKRKLLRTKAEPCSAGDASR